MVEVIVRVNLDTMLEDDMGPAILLSLQVIATIIALTYVVYEAVYPYVNQSKH